MQENNAKLISEQSQGWRLSIVQVKQDLVGIMWRDIHQPVKGRIEQALNYYEGMCRILQIVPNYVSSITIEVDKSIQQNLLNPYQSD